MPTCRRKRVVLTEPSDALLQAVKSDPNKEVYYLEQTGEIFDSYEYACLPSPPPCPPRLTPPRQSLCRPHVLLQTQTVPMRGHRQKRPRLLSGHRQ